jgi:hypothetical protein
MIALKGNAGVNKLESFQMKNSGLLIIVEAHYSFLYPNFTFEN